MKTKIVKLEMSSNDGSNGQGNQLDGANGGKLKYGQGIHDNGPAWKSNVTRNADGSFPFDEKMFKERPDDHFKMIRERISYLDAENRVHRVPKKYGMGRSKPL